MNEKVSEFNGTLSLTTGVIFQLFVGGLILARGVWFVFNAAPYTVQDVVFIAAILAVDLLIFWDVFLKEPRRVRLSQHEVELCRLFRNETVPLEDVVRAEPDMMGRPLLIHSGGKSRLGLQGAELQRFLHELREKKPRVAIKGLAAS